MSWITSSSVAAHAHPAWISGRWAVTARPSFNAHENACQYLRPLRQQKTLPLSLTSGKPSTIGHYLENRGIQQRCKREVAAFSSSSGGENQGDVAQNQSAPSESTADNDFEGDGEMGLEAEDDDIIFDYDEVEDEDHDDYDDETIDIDDFELFDDELLLQIDDNFIVAARKLDQFDEGWEGGFEEDGMEFRNIDDETLLEILGLPDEESTKKDIPSEDDLDESSADENPNEGGEEMDAQNDGSKDKSLEVPEAELSPSSTPIFTPLENALLQGVVPADAGVGSGRLPGDFGWDPLGLSSKDYFKKSQRFLLNRLPEREKLDNGDGGAVPPIRRSVADQDARPPALILRDYREAEIRHGRLVSHPFYMLDLIYRVRRKHIQSFTHFCILSIFRNLKIIGNAGSNIMAFGRTFGSNPDPRCVWFDNCNLWRSYLALCPPDYGVHHVKSRLPRHFCQDRKGGRIWRRVSTRGVLFGSAQDS